MKKILTVITSGIIVSAMAVTYIASAQNQNSSTSSNSSHDNQNSSSSASQQSSSSQGLSSERKRACEDKQASIEQAMSGYSNMLQNRLLIMNKVVDRIKDYYTNNGLKVEDYTQLTYRVTTMQQTATKMVNRVCQNSSFSCGSKDPANDAKQYRIYVREAQEDLKEYKTDISKLIDAIIQKVK